MKKDIEMWLTVLDGMGRLNHLSLPINSSVIDAPDSSSIRELYHFFHRVHTDSRIWQKINLVIMIITAYSCYIRYRTSVEISTVRATVKNDSKRESVVLGGWRLIISVSGSIIWSVFNIWWRWVNLPWKWMRNTDSSHSDSSSSKSNWLWKKEFESQTNSLCTSISGKNNMIGLFIGWKSTFPLSILLLIRR